ncbi:MAG: zinc ribbon domain-containing protein [Deltaproteobacteria bacterium]|jgi:putative FmdB family regulatory protein|nr:zinc ribbon domain-containing protein [Syntrophaceae bacterium]
MPIYEYRCKKCGKQFEAFQGITEPDLKTCKFCRGKVQKMMSLSSFSLKGSGWYATDYAGKKPQPAKHKEESSPAETSPAAADSSAAAGGKED